MTTDRYQFPTKEMRDLAYETEVANGAKGVTKRTDQVEGKMVYILAVPVPVSPKTRKSTIADNAKIDLTTDAESENMTNEGAPNV